MRLREKQRKLFEERNYISTTEAMELWGIKRRAIMYALAEDRIPGVKREQFGTWRWMIPGLRGRRDRREKVTRDTRKEMVIRWQDGESATALAREYGISRQRLYQIKDELGVERPETQS